MNEQTSKRLPHILIVDDTAMSLIDVVRKLRVLEEKAAHLELATENLSRLCDLAIQTVRHRLEQKEITVINHVPPGIKVCVEPTLFLHSVLCNLLTNAAKFSPRKSSVHIAYREEDAERLCLSVTDSGVGIPPDLLNALFDPARQTTRPGTEGEPGTGFGMVLARQIVELSGGTIRVESREAGLSPGNHGTTVHILLPRQP